MSNPISKEQLLPATTYSSSGGDGQRRLADSELVLYAAPTSTPQTARFYHNVANEGLPIGRIAKSEECLMLVGQQAIGSTASSLALLNNRHRRDMLADVSAFNPSSSGATLGTSRSPPLSLFSAAAMATVPTVYEGPDYRSQIADIYADHQRLLLSSIRDASLSSRPTTQQLLSTLLKAEPPLSSMLPQSRLQLPPATFPRSHQASLYNMLQASQALAANGSTSIESHSATFGGLEVNSFLTGSSPLSGAPPVLVSTATGGKLAVNDPLFDLLQHAEANMSRIMDPSPTRRRGTKENFPMVLHRVLIQLELSKQDTRIAMFLLDGKSFQIRNHFLFEQEVLPVFFPKMKGFASFQRQLNLYDFKRIGGAGIDRGAYRHDLFVRDYPASSSKMKRRKRKRGPLLSRGETAASSTKVRSQSDDGTTEENEPSSVGQDQAPGEKAISG